MARTGSDAVVDDSIDETIAPTGPADDEQTQLDEAEAEGDE